MSYWNSNAYAAMHDTRLNEGLVGIKYTALMIPNRKYRVHVQTPDESEYRYMIDLDPNLNWFPLQCGNGRYMVKVYEEVEQGTNKYTAKAQGWVDLSLEYPLAVFLASCFYMAWNFDMQCICVAKKITENDKADHAKAKTIWNAIVNDFKYDAALAANVKYNYTPDLMDIYVRREGICFGLTSLYNSQLRSLGIPAKMLHGYAGSAYHAWSEIYLDGAWNHVDITFDTAEKGKRGFLAEKLGLDYTVKFFY